MNEPASSGPVPAAGEREAAMEEALRKSAIRLTSPEWEGPDDPQVFELRVADLLTALWDGDGLDEAVADLAAAILADPPAVPVGVQPEPAEEETPAETLLRDIFTDPAQRAVPVVHPEPGDRAGMLAEIDTLGPVGMLVMVDAIRAEAGGGWWTKRGWLADEYVAAVRPLTVLYDENDEPTTVAAAVAAVRADLAVKLETLLEAAERIGFDHSGESPDCAACETYTAAAAVRSATKEGLG